MKIFVPVMVLALALGFYVKARGADEVQANESLEIKYMNEDLTKINILDLEEYIVTNVPNNPLGLYDVQHAVSGCMYTVDPSVGLKSLKPIVEYAGEGEYIHSCR